MLTPEYLAALPEALVRLWQQAEDDILRDIGRRLKPLAEGEAPTATAAWQLWRLEQTRALRQDVTRLLAKYGGKSDAEIRRILQAAGTEALAADDAFYAAGGLAPGDVNDSPALRNLLNAGYRQTRGTWKNLTATTANTVGRQFEDALDRAWLQVSSGAFDYNTAVRRAVKGLAEGGLKAVSYPTGHTDTLEAAVRRAVLTGVNQTAAKLQLARMEEFGWEFVEVTAHAGARPEHALWQGRRFHRGGAVVYRGVLYEDFETATGYGTGPGLCGWNCRHSFFPCDPDTPPVYTDGALEALNAREAEYGGSLYTRYEISQMQRALERKVRSAKRQYLTESAAGLDTAGSAARLRQARQALNRFARDTGGRLDSARTAVQGFGRSEAGKANAVARKNHTDWLKSIGAEKTELNTLAKYDQGKYNNSPAYQMLMGYSRAVEKGDISPLVGIDLYERYAQDVQEQIVGQTTATGVTIESFAWHFVDRVIGQVSEPHAGKRCGVSVKDALDALINPVRVGPLRTMSDGDTRQTFYGSHTAVTISVRDRLLIQTNPNGG